MNPTQLRAIVRLDEQVSILARQLMAEYDLTEDEALELIYESENYVDQIQDGQTGELYEAIVLRAKDRVVNSPHNPKEYYPGHPNFMAPITFPGAFNAHMAQAMAPYAIAIAKKVALDRGLEPPNDQEIIKALEQSDWAKAAYEAKRMPAHPSVQRVRDFLSRYIGKPLGKVTDKIPLAQLFAFATSGTMMWMLWATFKNHIEQVGSPAPAAFGKYTNFRQRQALKKAFKG